MLIPAILIWVNLFIDSEVELDLPDGAFDVENGEQNIHGMRMFSIKVSSKKSFDLQITYPNSSLGARVSFTDKRSKRRNTFLKNGYAVIERQWSTDDKNRFVFTNAGRNA